MEKTFLDSSSNRIQVLEGKGKRLFKIILVLFTGEAADPRSQII